MKTYEAALEGYSKVLAAKQIDQNDLQNLLAGIVRFRMIGSDDKVLESLIAFSSEIFECIKEDARTDVDAETRTTGVAETRTTADAETTAEVGAGGDQSEGQDHFNIKFTDDELKSLWNRLIQLSRDVSLDLGLGSNSNLDSTIIEKLRELVDQGEDASKAIEIIEADTQSTARASIGGLDQWWVGRGNGQDADKEKLRVLIDEIEKKVSDLDVKFTQTQISFRYSQSKKRAKNVLYIDRASKDAFLISLPLQFGDKEDAKIANEIRDSVNSKERPFVTGRTKRDGVFSVPTDYDDEDVDFVLNRLQDVMAHHE